MAAHLALAMALGCCLLSSPGVMAKAHKTLLIPGPIEFHEDVLAVRIATRDRQRASPTSRTLALHGAKVPTLAWARGVGRPCPGLLRSRVRDRHHQHQDLLNTAACTPAGWSRQQRTKSTQPPSRARHDRRRFCAAQGSAAAGALSSIAQGDTAWQQLTIGARDARCLRCVQAAGGLPQSHVDPEFIAEFGETLELLRKVSSGSIISRNSSSAKTCRWGRQGRDVLGRDLAARTPPAGWVFARPVLKPACRPCVATEAVGVHARCLAACHAGLLFGEGPAVRGVWQRHARLGHGGGQPGACCAAAGEAEGSWEGRAAWLQREIGDAMMPWDPGAVGVRGPRGSLGEGARDVVAANLVHARWGLCGAWQRRPWPGDWAR